MTRGAGTAHRNVSRIHNVLVTNSNTRYLLKKTNRQTKKKVIQPGAVEQNSQQRIVKMLMDYQHKAQKNISQYAQCFNRSNSATCTAHNSVDKYMFAA